MKDSWIGQVGVWGCGSPVETSAEGRSNDRAGRRDQRPYRYLKENKPTLVNVMRMNGNLKSISARWTSRRRKCSFSW